MPARLDRRSDHFLGGASISERFSDRATQSGGVIGIPHVAPRALQTGSRRSHRPRTHFAFCVARRKKTLMMSLLRLAKRDGDELGRVARRNLTEQKWRQAFARRSVWRDRAAGSGPHQPGINVTRNVKSISKTNDPMIIPSMRLRASLKHLVGRPKRSSIIAAMPMPTIIPGAKGALYI